MLCLTNYPVCNSSLGVLVNIWVVGALFVINSYESVIYHCLSFENGVQISSMTIRIGLSDIIVDNYLGNCTGHLHNICTSGVATWENPRYLRYWSTSRSAGYKLSVN